MPSHRKEPPAQAPAHGREAPPATRNVAVDRNVVADRARTASAEAPARARVRMYRQGLGDCFLLTFQPGAPDEAHVLVDIGTIGKGDGVPLDDVVRDIAETTGGRLAAVVATHEHADHVSGFAKLKDAGVRADEIWLAWTEDPTDPLAKQLEKYRGDLFAAAEQAAFELDGAEREGLVGALKAGVRDLMTFQGFAPAREGEPLAAAAARSGGLKKTLQDMMRSAVELAARRCHWSPGEMFERPWAPGVRFFVLGPPRDPAAIQRLGEHGSPDLYALAFVTAAKLPSAAGAPRDAEAHDSWEPFDHELMIPVGAAGPLAAAYDAEPWRRIDEATFGASAELALQLDNATNNTSLALAIEVGGEVLLFPGDAQLGSWLTWPEVEFVVREDGGERTVRGEDLLRRTTFYKVGHHGSHNATAKPGLELMGERGLIAFIPLDEGVARNRKWPMPARRLVARLEEKARGRVTKSDRDADALGLPSIRVEKLWVEVTLPVRPPAPAATRPSAVEHVVE